MELLAIGLVIGAIVLFRDDFTGGKAGGGNINIRIGGSDPSPLQQSGGAAKGGGLGGGGGGLGGFGSGGGGSVPGSSGGSNGSTWRDVQEERGTGIPLTGETGAADIAGAAFPGSGGAAGSAFGEGAAAGVADALYEPGGILGDRDIETPDGFGSTLDDWSPDE